MVKSIEIIIIGGGIFGLTIAERLSALGGANIVLLEAYEIGAGSSGGILGALTPHMPEPWNPKKAFQYKALCSLSTYIEALEAETGLSCGYARIGRITPLQTPRAKELAQMRAAHSQDTWPNFTFRYTEQNDSRLIDSVAPYGFIHDTLSARLQPRAYLNTLVTALRQRGVTIKTQARYLDLKEQQVTYVYQGRQHQLKAEHIIFAHGWQSFTDAAKATDTPSLGKGEKGQNSLLRPKEPFTGPLIYADGTYIIPHQDGTVAVGGAAAKDFTDNQADLSLDYVHKAQMLCPALQDAEILEHWAGIRPRADKRDAVLGTLRTGVHLLTGGFKIGFGIAHHLATVLASQITHMPAPDLPPRFTLAFHLDESRKSAQKNTEPLQ